LAEFHLWFGWVFAALPLLAIGATRPLLEDLRRRLGPPDGVAWRKLNMVITGVASLLPSVSGIVLWLFLELPLIVEDVLLEIHIWATRVLTASLPVHLVVARHKIAERLRHPFGVEPPPLFEFVDEDPDPDDP